MIPIPEILIVVIPLVMLILFVLPLYLPPPYFETLVKVIGQIRYIGLVVAFIGPLQKRYASKLVEDVSVKTDARLSVSRHLRSNPGHVKPVSTLQVQFDIESRSPVDITPDGAQINAAFVSGGIPFETLYWNPEISPRPPSGFEIQTIPAKGDSTFTIEFIPPIFLYYTKRRRTLYFDGWISMETGFGTIPIDFHTNARLEEQHVETEFRGARKDFEEGFDVFQPAKESSE